MFEADYVICLVLSFYSSFRQISNIHVKLTEVTWGAVVVCVPVSLSSVTIFRPHLNVTWKVYFPWAITHLSVKHNAHRHTDGECLVNMLPAVSDPLLFEGNRGADGDLTLKQQAGNEFWISCPEHWHSAVSLMTCRWMWGILTSLRLHEFLAQTCCFSHLQYVHSAGNQHKLNQTQRK